MKTLIFDFSRVVLLPRDRTFSGGLNKLHRDLSPEPSYNFFDYFEFNEELLNFLEANKERMDLYVFTTGTIQNAPEVQARIKGIFKKFYTVDELGLHKESPEAFKLIAKDLGKKPEEILFIDDTLANVQAAQAAGYQTIHFVDNKEIFKTLGKR